MGEARAAARQTPKRIQDLSADVRAGCELLFFCPILNMSFLRAERLEGEARIFIISIFMAYYSISGGNFLWDT
jgi:hypothetical protein